MMSAVTRRRPPLGDGPVSQNPFRWRALVDKVPSVKGLSQSVLLPLPTLTAGVHVISAYCICHAEALTSISLGLCNLATVDRDRPALP